MPSIAFTISMMNVATPDTFAPLIGRGERAQSFGVEIPGWPRPRRFADELAATVKVRCRHSAKFDVSLREKARHYCLIDLPEPLWLTARKRPNVVA